MAGEAPIMTSVAALIATAARTRTPPRHVLSRPYHPPCRVELNKFCFVQTMSPYQPYFLKTTPPVADS